MTNELLRKDGTSSVDCKSRVPWIFTGNHGISCWQASSFNHISWHKYMNQNRNNHMMGNLDMPLLCHALYSRMFTHFICLFCLICYILTSYVWDPCFNRYDLEGEMLLYILSNVSRKSSVYYTQISLPTPWTVVRDQWRCWHNGTIPNCSFSKSIEMKSSTETITS